MKPFTCSNCGKRCDCDYLCPGCSGTICSRCVHLGNDGRSHEMEMTMRTFRCAKCKELANKRNEKEDEMIITTKMLKAKLGNACTNQVKQFDELFPNGAKINAKNIKIAIKNHLNINWAALNLLSPKQLAEYKRIKEPAWAEYIRIEESAYAKYEHLKEPALVEYKSIKKSAFTEYKHIEGPAFLAATKIKDNK